MKYAVLVLALLLAAPSAWALTIKNNGDGSFTVTPTAAELQIIQRAMKEHGAAVVKTVLENWIQGRAAYQAEQDRLTIKERYDALTPEQQSAVKAILGLP